MTAKQLYKILSGVIKASGDVEVMVNAATFPESENGTVFEIESATVEEVQGADDSGPVGGKEPMLIIKGTLDWHAHGDPI